MNSQKWLYATDVDDVPVGTLVLTPSNKQGIVIKHRTGASKADGCSRVVGRYVDGSKKSLFTLQPQLLRIEGKKC
jgi:hypothetical protein